MQSNVFNMIQTICKFQSYHAVASSFLLSALTSHVVSPPACSLETDLTARFGWPAHPRDQLFMALLKKATPKRQTHVALFLKMFGLVEIEMMSGSSSSLMFILLWQQLSKIPSFLRKPESTEKTACPQLWRRLPLVAPFHVSCGTGFLIISPR